MSGGATFTPRLKIRPPPLDNWYVAKKGILSAIRVPVLAMLFCKLCEPFYFAAAGWWMSKGLSERLFVTVGTTVLHILIYTSMNCFFLLCDRRGYLEEYKLDRTPAMGPSEDLLWRTWIEAAIGQAITGPIALYYLVYPTFKYCGSPAMDAALPGAREMVWFFFLAHLINGWLFYWSHRLVHSKTLYARIHKQHHTYKGTVGFAAEFAHPVEQIVSNQIPTAIACVLGGSHFCVWFVWLLCRLEQTYEAHSGYCFYGTTLWKIGLTNAEHCAYHDYHHTGNRGNFGGPVYLDHIFGTMDAWVAMGGVEGYIAKKKLGAPTGNVLRNDFVGKKSKNNVPERKASSRLQQIRKHI